jgi:trk system potassium uptake protein TrkA
MRVVVVGAGEVGEAAVASLHEDHDCTVLDLDPERLEAISHEFDVRIVEGSGGDREALEATGVASADLVLACTPRDEVNLVTAMLVRRLGDARTVVRTTDMADLKAWREGYLDVDFMVSSELETANAIARVTAVPGARQADFFLDGEVQVLEFDLVEDAPPSFSQRPLEDADLPADSRVVGIIREGNHVVPKPRERLSPGDRLIVVASRSAALEWSRLLVAGERSLADVAVFGGGRVGEAVARVLLERGIGVRLVEPDTAHARSLAGRLPAARVYSATGFERDFLRRERIGAATAAVFSMHSDMKNLYAAVRTKLYGVSFTIAVLEDSEAAEVLEAAGVDVAVDPAIETAEVMVRFARDPRIRQIAMLEDDRLEVLDIAIRGDSPAAGRVLAQLPSATGTIGAIVRDGQTRFPTGDERLTPGDRVIVLGETDRVGAIERAL